MVALEPLVAKGWLAAPQVPAFCAEHVDYGRVTPWREQQLRAAASRLLRRRRAADQQPSPPGARPSRLAGRLRALHGHPLAAERPALVDLGRPQAPRARPWPPRASSMPARSPSGSSCSGSSTCRSAALKAYANERGVHLMGDLPIFVAHDSADCWSRPDLYHLDDEFQTTVVAGVPPDLGPLGQRWGNPLYRWDRMAAEDYAWWTARVPRAGPGRRVPHRPLPRLRRLLRDPGQSPTPRKAAG
jgi:4-alpha-glucanotransferase